VNPFAFDRQIHAASVLAYLGSATLVLFAHSYFPGGSHLVCWALLSVLFIGIAWSTRRDLFFHHSVLVAFLVFFRAFAYELQIGGRRGLPGSFSPAFYVSVAAAVLFAGLAFAFPLRQRFATRAKSSGSDELGRDIAEVLRRPEQIYFFLPFILATLLILNEISFGRVTIAWGIEAVAAFLFALVVGERSFRLAGLGLLLVCVAKIGLLDVWRQHSSDRYITLIILGIALLLVSYLYTRYSEAIRRYL
jgi:ribose/xylose/arabinose/galactoside ABC-type transport system permease subunit